MSKGQLDHNTALASVLEVVRLVESAPDSTEEELVEKLKACGFSDIHAEKLAMFVPSAFAWALLQRVGPPAFPCHYIVLDQNRSEVELPIAQEHFFTAALDLAYRTLETGWSKMLSKAAFDLVLRRSAEIGAANQLLTAGEELKDASLLPLRLFRISAEAANES